MELKTIKTKIKQIFCRHKETELMTQKGPFFVISGERVYKVCKRCGKVTSSYFLEHEGRGYK